MSVPAALRQRVGCRVGSAIPQSVFRNDVGREGRGT